jgi:hypothetical protein
LPSDTDEAIRWLRILEAYPEFTIRIGPWIVIKETQQGIPSVSVAKLSQESIAQVDSILQRTQTPREAHTMLRRRVLCSLQSKTTMKLFCLYSDEDAPLWREFHKHLAPLQREGLIATCDHHEISAGTVWAKEIDIDLQTARVILFLVSADFLNSSKHGGTQGLDRAMQRHEAGEARVIPVLLRPVVWDSEPFAVLQVLPRNRVPVTRWENRDQAFTEITENIRTVVRELNTING